MMKKYAIAVLLLGLSGMLNAQQLWNLPHLERVKQSLNEPYYAAAYRHLAEDADSLLQCRPMSVMDKAEAPASGDKHDYMSLARYYWPDASKPDGLPYVNRDGLSNPELNRYDRNRLGTTCRRINTLALAWYLSGNEAYAAKAAGLARTWFLDPATRMNPNLNYAQIAKGHNGNRGRSYGVLDAYSLVETLDALTLLEGSKSFPARDQKKMRRWVKDLRRLPRFHALLAERYTEAHSF